MTTTQERLRQWVEWWRDEGLLDDRGPRRPRDVSAYHDKQLRQSARAVATVTRERGR